MKAKDSCYVLIMPDSSDEERLKANAVVVEALYHGLRGAKQRKPIPGQDRLNEAALGLARDWKSVVVGESVSVRVDLGGRRRIKKRQGRENSRDEGERECE